MDQQAAESRALIAGTWKLITFENRSDAGRVAYPFGKEARGTILYAASGRFALQIVRADRPLLAAGNQMQGTPDEIKANFEGCMAYYGWYEFEPQAGFVVHHVEASLYPNWEGQALKRYAELAGNRLTLTTPPMAWGGRDNFVGWLVWERM